MEAEIDRLWRIVLAVRASPDEPKKIAEQPNMKDSLFVQLLIEAASDEIRFRRCVSANRSLLEWAAGRTEEELFYWTWLHRQQIAA